MAAIGSQSLASGGGYPRGVLGFFSFTEVTDPSAHEAYNAWHQLDHLPEQFTIDGISFGQRWVRSPRCRSAEAATGSLLERFHYMTLYLLRDEGVVPPFFALAERLCGRGPLLRGAARAAVGALRRGRPLGRAPRGGVPRGRPLPPGARGSTWSWARPSTARRWWSHHGVAGAWQFADAERGRTITVAFVDGDLWQASAGLGAAGGDVPRMGGPTGAS